MSETVRFIVDGAVLEEMTRGPGGMVWNFLERRAVSFQERAREQAPIRTGDLRKSIVKRPIEPAPGGLGIRVIAAMPYALFVHEGTRPHNIPNAFGYGPTFGIGGRFEGMFHPGNHANHFLTDNLGIFAE